MARELSRYLWILKLGTLANILSIAFFARTRALELGEVDTRIAIPAPVLFVVSAYRCALPFLVLLSILISVPTIAEATEAAEVTVEPVLSVQAWSSPAREYLTLASSCPGA